MSDSHDDWLEANRGMEPITLPARRVTVIHRNGNRAPLAGAVWFYDSGECDAWPQNYLAQLGDA